MKNFEIPNLPDEVYASIERRAKEVGRSPAEVAADILARDVASEQKEAALMAEIRQGREEMAKKGIYMTAEDIQSAIDWGRE
jgi:plasmid stability protein